MTQSVGAYLGSVCSLETLRDRCFVENSKGCWHLRSARGRDLSGRSSDGPLKVHVHGRGGVPARRVAWEWLHGRKPGPDEVVTNTCDSADCVKPWHLAIFSQAEFGQHLRAKGASMTPRKHMALVRMSRSRRSTKLTDELAQWARESDQQQGDVAHAFGVSKQRISDIRRGKSWNSGGTTGSSVFAWRPAA